MAYEGLAFQNPLMARGVETKDVPSLLTPVRERLNGAGLGRNEPQSGRKERGVGPPRERQVSRTFWGHKRGAERKVQNGAQRRNF